MSNLITQFSSTRWIGYFFSFIIFHLCKFWIWFCVVIFLFCTGICLCKKKHFFSNSFNKDLNQVMLKREFDFFRSTHFPVSDNSTDNIIIIFIIIFLPFYSKSNPDNLTWWFRKLIDIQGNIKLYHLCPLRLSILEYKES